MNKILVITPSWVGDCMLMQPMLMLLKQRYPYSRIDALAPSWTASLLCAMPEINKVIANPFPHGALHLIKRIRLGLQLRTEKYDQAIILPNSFKSALPPYFARIPLRTGFVGEMRYGLLNDVRKLDKTALPLMVQRFAQLAVPTYGDIPCPLFRPELTVSKAQREAVLDKLGLTLDQPVTIFCPGAEYGQAKRWPIAYFAETAQRLQQNMGHEIWLIGSAKDKEVGNKIIALGNPAIRNLCGSTDLAEALALLSCAELVISNDSGLMHLAAALDIPLIALFGSSSPQFTPPLSKHARVLKIDIACSPCFKRECPKGHFDCMNLLTPDMIWENIQQILYKGT